MDFDMNWLLRVMLLLTGLSLTRGQSVASPPVFTPAALSSHAGTSEPPDLTEDPANELPQIRNPGTDLSTETTSTSTGLIRAHSVTNAAFTANMLSSSSAVAPTQHVNVPAVMTTQPGTASRSDLLSSTPTAQSTTPLPHISHTDGRASQTRDPFATFSSQPAHVSTQPQPEPRATATAQASTTAGRPLTSASARGPAGPTHQEVPSELNVGDEDKRPRRSSSPLDPLLAGLLSVFIVTTAVIFVVLFLRFRQRTNHPEFHRLQDLPMDDLLEDTPLSRYTY